MRGPRLRETHRYVKSVLALQQKEVVVFGRHEVAATLRKWADLNERAGNLHGALALREASIWFDTAEYVSGEPGYVVFREFEKQVNELVAEARLHEETS